MASDIIVKIVLNETSCFYIVTPWDTPRQYVYQQVNDMLLSDNEIIPATLEEMPLIPTINLPEFMSKPLGKKMNGRDLYLYEITG